MATSGHKSISRIDSKKANSWYRVKFNKKNHTKFFSDGVHGGENAALEATIDWRNQKERELGKPRTDRMIVASFPGNNTGYSGVARTKKWTGRGAKKGSFCPIIPMSLQLPGAPNPGLLAIDLFQ